MRQERKQADSFDTWQHLVASVAANAADLAHLEVPRQRLEGMLKEVKDLTASQAALASSKQEASKRIEELVVSGRRLAAVLKVAVKEHYGTRSEKLTEFRLQPFRGRKLKAPVPPAEPSRARRLLIIRERYDLYIDANLLKPWARSTWVRGGRTRCGKRGLQVVVRRGRVRTSSPCAAVISRALSTTSSPGSYALWSILEPCRPSKDPSDRA